VSNGLDCLAADCGRMAPVPAPPPRSYAGVDLMARDFDSLLRAMLDQLPRLAPEWQDRSEADLGLVLLELFAYAGDQLSYLHDRVALEGFLRTATQAESVRRLLRMIDYDIHPGYAAEAPLVFECTGAAPLFLPRGFPVSTRTRDEKERVTYETVEDAVLHPALSVVPLAADAPSSADGLQAVFQTDLTGTLVPGASLLLQQGDVREWARVAACAFAPAATTVTFEAPLRFTYSAAGDPSSGIPSARAHGNRVRATHGARYVVEQTGTGEPAQTVTLEHAPITWTLEASDEDAAPVSTLTVTVDGEGWVEVEDFIDSRADARHYRVTRDNAGFATVHFGGGAFGAAPEPGSRIVVRCRIGIGSPGHVARETLVAFDETVRFADPGQRITVVRNPFAALTPRDPQSLGQAKLLGPAQLRVQRRAVVPADFERALAGGAWVAGQRVVPLQSRARVRNTGSWNTVVVSVDMPGRLPLDAQTREAFEALLRARKMAGLDVRVEDARYRPMHIGLTVDVEREHFARDVRQAVERALVGPSAGGAPAFFEPGRLRFGEPVFLSDLYAVVAAVPGVRAVAVTRFKRLGDRYPDSEGEGVIPVGPLEVARLDNDPAAPEFGVLAVRTCGGKEG